ncbi:hypothetical protein ACFPM3_18410 [Streptomyces coeruleoprunus]|uniref:Uncharacterized protein n=1 Tax=Streptomyces coeruleoprunus TaxID=285563 RepID=A0ABV9XGJ9_9ACTN
MTTESPTTTASPAASTPHIPWPTPWPGFVVVRDLPGKPVHVTLVLTDEQGATVLERQIGITPKPTYPNGRNCSPGGNQARLTVTAKGVLIPR